MLLKSLITKIALLTGILVLSGAPLFAQSGEQLNNAKRVLKLLQTRNADSSALAQKIHIDHNISMKFEDYQPLIQLAEILDVSTDYFFELEVLPMYFFILKDDGPEGFLLMRFWEKHNSATFWKNFALLFPNVQGIDFSNFKYDNHYDTYLFENISVKKLILRNAFPEDMQELPDWILKIPELEDLDVSENRLIQLPDWLHELKNLKHLNIRFNQLLELPESLKKITALESLNVSSNRRDGDALVIPNWVSDFKQLKSLHVAYTKATTQAIFNCKKLEILDISGLGYLQKDFNRLSALPHLQELYLANCYLEEIPEGLGQLKKLKGLHLAFNYISELPPFLFELTNLEWLELGDNPIYNVPPEIGNLKNLKELYIWKRNSYEIGMYGASRSKCDKIYRVGLLNKKEYIICDDYLFKFDTVSTKDYPCLKSKDALGSIILLYDLPQEISQLTNLEILVLANNSFTKIPKALAPLKKLKYLDLSDNIFIAEIPDFIGELPNLDSLKLKGNRIARIPESLCKKGSNLKVLDLESNQIQNIPDEISNLNQLECLKLKFNRLWEFYPMDIQQLTQLKWLDISYNNIVELPEEMGDLPKLMYLDLSNNELQDIPLNFKNLPSNVKIRIGHNKMLKSSIWEYKELFPNAIINW